MIGFLNTSYSADESSELTTLRFGLLSGEIQDTVNIRLDLIDETALGKKTSKTSSTWFLSVL